jgi:hypothetical protein
MSDSDELQGAPEQQRVAALQRELRKQQRTNERKDAELRRLKAKLGRLHHEKRQSDINAKRQRFSSEATQSEVFQDPGILEQVLEYAGPEEYLFSASISRKCRQMQVVLSHRAAAESKRTKHKLRTSFTAAIASAARLQWALECGLKRKAQYTKPVEIVQDVLKVSADPAEVLAQLIVLHFKRSTLTQPRSSALQLLKEGTWRCCSSSLTMAALWMLRSASWHSCIAIWTF